MVCDEHAQILAGSSIGETFKANGWTIFKETRYVGELQVPAHSPAVLELMALHGRDSLAMHAYRLLLKKDQQTIDYTMIVDVHGPDYLGSEDVTGLYLVDAPARLTATELQEVSELVLQPQ